ncbi:MAG TPA: DUF2786 domain-containing protein [Acidimicrobiales bacterium]|nr:DUF2786 domain-containing protein [Acidimicrobiales bacterium]
MGINNKQRRRMKQAKRQERRRATQDGYGPPRAQHGWHEEGVDLMIDLAIEAAIQADDPAKAPQLAMLVERDATIRTRVVPRLQSWLAQVHRAALRHGWHTDEMARVARRRAGAAAADLVGGLVDGAPAAVEPTNTESWPATVAAAVGALAVMAHLPPLPDLGAVRRGAAPGVDERLLARVRALLAKAESTEFSQEAEACLAKAQALMARHSLDHLAIEGHASEACPLEARRLWLDDPYLQAKALRPEPSLRPTAAGRWCRLNSASSPWLAVPRTSTPSSSSSPPSWCMPPTA